MRFARGPGCDWIRYDRPAAAAIGADKYARIGTARDEDVGILRVEGDQGRLGIAAKSGKGGGTPPVLVNERTSTGHRAVEAGVVGPGRAAICREHHPRPGRCQVRGVKSGWVAWIDRKDANTTAGQIAVDANPRTRRVGPDKPPELIRSSPVAHAGLHEKRRLSARHTELDAACTGGRSGGPELCPHDRRRRHIVGDEYPLRRDHDEIGCSEVADHINGSETRKGARRIGVYLGSARHAWIAKEQAISRRGRETAYCVEDARQIGAVVEAVAAIPVGPGGARGPGIGRSETAVILVAEIEVFGEHAGLIGTGQRPKPERMRRDIRLLPEWAVAIRARLPGVEVNTAIRREKNRTGVFADPGRKHDSRRHRHDHRRFA